MWPAVRHNRCTRFSPTLMPSSWSTLHATATGTRMWAPVAAISRTSGKTILSAGSPSTGRQPPAAHTVSWTEPSGLNRCVVLDVVELGLLAGEDAPSFRVGVERVAKERRRVVHDDVERSCVPDGVAADRVAVDGVLGPWKILARVEKEKVARAGKGDECLLLAPCVVVGEFRAPRVGSAFVDRAAHGHDGNLELCEAALIEEVRVACQRDGGRDSRVSEGRPQTGGDLVESGSHGHVRLVGKGSAEEVAGIICCQCRAAVLVGGEVELSAGSRERGVPAVGV